MAEENRRLTNIELQQEVEELKNLVKRQSDVMDAQAEKIEELTDASAKLPPDKKAPYKFDPQPPPGGGWLVRTANTNLFGKFAKTDFKGGMAIVMPNEPEADTRMAAMADYDGYEIITVEQEDLLPLYQEIATAEPKPKELHEMLGG